MGNRAYVSFLVPIGDNPEDYDPLPSDMQKISNADIIFMNGWGLETGIERAVTNINNKVVFLTENITPIYLAGEESPDPHAWLDAKLVADFYIDSIIEALAVIDPEGIKEYKKNALIYKNKLLELDNWIKDKVDFIPINNKIIVINENALKYYGQAYGFKTEGIWELNSHEEGTPQQILRIINIVKDNNLPAIFTETTVDNRYMKIISQETNTPIGGMIYTDALGLPNSGAETYIKMMKHNTKIFFNALIN